MVRRLAFILLLGLILRAEDLLVVTNPSNDIGPLDAVQLRQIYLGKRRYWKTLKLFPINLPPGNPLRRKFEIHLLHMTPSALDAYWMKEHYLGRRPPYRVESIESVIRFVKKLKGAIGYIPQHRMSRDLKVIYRIEDE
ncbi:hypothetical protein [Hydrogenimonas urashimensis]|uniref:hypothetical protein n=1 Tax=Hydrogenimonas urashimensis TaxID=2740515 RepID=UPI00191628A8|nr:hypothetical protein [Hydrogenimonas urashimensis]